VPALPETLSTMLSALHDGDPVTGLEQLAPFPAIGWRDWDWLTASARRDFVALTRFGC
jgi:hypothetical protein